MKVAAITLLLSMAGASALGIKAAKTRAVANAARRMQESLQKVQVSFDMLMQSRRLDAHEGGGGPDMAGMMKPECQEACPGVKDMAMAFMEMAMSGSTTTAAPGKEGEAMMAMLQEVMCPHVDALTCMGKADACKGTTRRLDAHEGGGDMMGMIGCMCVCPDLAAISGSRRRLDANEDSGDGDASMKAMCDNPKGTIGCMSSKPECKSMEDMMKKGMPEHMQDDYAGYMGLMCDWQSSDCEKKGESCEDTNNEFEAKGCGKPETTDKTPCCDTAKKIADCQGKECLDMSMAMLSMGTGDEGTKTMLDEILKVSKACPDAGIPKSKDEIDAVVKKKENKMKGIEEPAVSADAASGAFHTIPAFGMVAIVLAFAAVANI